MGEQQANGRESPDLTEREPATEVFRRIVEEVPSALLMVDERGRIALVNTKTEELFGYRREELLGRPVEMLVPERFRASHLLRRDSLFRGSADARLAAGSDLVGLRDDGTEVPIEIGLTPITSGEERWVLASILDATERRLAEETLRETEHQLLHSQKIEAIGRLAGGIAHDFNNYLTIISASIELLGQHRDDERARRLVDDVKKAGDRAADLTRQLLAFSRKQILRPTTLDLGRVVADLSRMLQPLIGEDVVLTTSSVPELWPMRADRGQIEQVIVNLAINSRDAMPRGGRLTIEAGNVELDEGTIQGRLELRPGRYVRLAVSDTGAGMDQDTRERIFEPFFTTKEAGKGTGLGLASAYGVVKQSGGFIYVYSEIGLGTTFKLYFPASEAAETSASLSNDTEAAAPRGGETILLVEDDDSLRALLSEALRGQGYEVFEASCGDEALRRFGEHGDAIDLVVTDVVMPGLSGRDLSEKLHTAKPGVEILFMSGYTDDAVVRHGVLEGDAAYLQKPFTPQMLGRKVREVLDR